MYNFHTFIIFVEENSFVFRLSECAQASEVRRLAAAGQLHSPASHWRQAVSAPAPKQSHTAHTTFLIKLYDLMDPYPWKNNSSNYGPPTGPPLGPPPGPRPGPGPYGQPR